MKVAAVQMDVKILDSAHNLSRILENLDAAARNGARVVVFPECALSGYCFNSREESYPVAETVPGPSTERLAEAARRLDCYVHGGARNIYWKRADGTGEVERLTESSNSQRPWSWSADGKVLAFNENGSETNWDLWTLPMEEDGAAA